MNTIINTLKRLHAWLRNDRIILLLTVLSFIGSMVFYGGYFTYNNANLNRDELELIERLHHENIRLTQQLDSLQNAHLCLEEN